MPVVYPLSAANLIRERATMYRMPTAILQRSSPSGDGITVDYEYDAYGNCEQEKDRYGNPFRYCGEYWDEETENIYLRARYYDSATGRFISEDPIQDGLNWYVYANNNPIGFVDPWGLSVTIIGGQIDQQKSFDELTALTDDTPIP